MAAEMIKEILKTEAKGREEENKAHKKAEEILQNAKIQADIIIKTAIEQAENEANIILSDAEYSSDGVLKQANKLAALREKKSIADTEKQYDEAIKLVFDEILK